MTVPERVFARIQARTIVDDNGCWLWPKRGLINGYGQIGWHQGGFPRRELTHRAAYLATYGAIPDGLQIDHRCHDPEQCKPPRAAECPHRRCCNPDHLKPATARENVLRGGGFAAENAVKDRCPSGHRYDDANTYVAPNGWRQCRACRSGHIAAFRLRRAS